MKKVIISSLVTILAIFGIVFFVAGMINISENSTDEDDCLDTFPLDDFSEMYDD